MTINWNAVTGSGRSSRPWPSSDRLPDEPDPAGGDGLHRRQPAGALQWRGRLFLAAAHDPEFRRARSGGGRHRPGPFHSRGLCARATEDEATRLAAGAQYWFWLHWGQWRSSMDEGDRRELRNMIERFYALPHIRVVGGAQGVDGRRLRGIRGRGPPRRSRSPRGGEREEIGRQAARQARRARDRYSLRRLERAGPAPVPREPSAPSGLHLAEGSAHVVGGANRSSSTGPGPSRLRPAATSGTVSGWTSRPRRRGPPALLWRRWR